MKKNYANLWIQKMQPYKPPIDGRTYFKGLLLDFNERTVPPSKKVLDVLSKFAKRGKNQVYPEYFDICEAIADYAGVDKSEVMIVNGSDQGMDIIFRTFTTPGGKVQIPAKSYAMFEQCAGLAGNEIVYDFEKDVQLIVICNPNNPTGDLKSVNEIEAILKKAKDSIVYVDEAYFEFSGVSAAGLSKRYPNLIISRTFSKAFGLAALRIGYVLASKENIEEMLKVRGPYDVNVPALYAAKAALSDVDDMKRYVDEVMNEAKPMIEKFFRENQIEFFKSCSNFILFKPENVPQVFEKLKNGGILTRLKGDMLRVTIGTSQQMAKFIKVYRKILSEADKLGETSKYAFLDRDGTLIYEPKGGLVDRLKILPGVIDNLKKLKKEGFNFVMVSNQDGLGTKSYKREIFDSVQDELIEILKKEGIEFEKVFICPHFEDDNCDCRKPKTGLIDAFLREKRVDFENSVMFGDRDSDMKFAENLGVRFVRIKTNNQFKYEP